MRVSLNHIAMAAGVSAKTVSGALHGSGAAMSADTRERIRLIARELGYVPNLAARAMRQGQLPIVGVIADGLITAPFATEIMRAFDKSLRASGLSGVVSSLGADRDIGGAVSDLERFVPRAIAYASMYHRVVDVPTDSPIQLMINCRDGFGRVAALVPDDEDAARTLVSYLLGRGRRSLAFLNLPGLLAGSLRLDGFRSAHDEAGLRVDEDRVRPATAGRLYTDRSRSLVGDHVAALLAGANPPDAIVCGNDRVALETYNALRRLGRRIPDDVAVASFDNQVEIAARLDPPLTTMALPHRVMGRLAADFILGKGSIRRPVEKVPFRLIERSSA